jgi:N5-(cytidine 5'-diphosphoramidyl)-L-glutamine hydrolase
MKLIAVSQRVSVIESYAERRDSLDQRWNNFLQQSGFLPILIPNQVEMAMQIVRTVPLKGILLTGGEDLCIHGGDSPERDKTEDFLFAYAREKVLPVLGICRGMQLIQNYYGIKLIELNDHVKKKQVIEINGKLAAVNSYHCLGSMENSEPLETWAVAKDGVIKAIKHRELPIQGVMWHPERMDPFRSDDIYFFQSFF